MLRFYKIIILCCIIFTSCNIISFENISISLNISETETYFSQDEIVISFSIMPDIKTTEKLISLKEDSLIQEIVFNWSNNQCKIHPLYGFKKNANYSLQLSGELMVNDGRFFDINLSRVFVYGIKNDQFSLLDYTNPNINESRHEIVLVFNKPVDISSFEKNFSISPSISITKEYSDDNLQIKIKPEAKWNVNTYYTWNIKNLKSTDNYEIRQEYSDTFIYDKDYLLPRLISANINDRKLDDTISFTFNKKININSFENNFSISPYTKGYFTQENETIIFHPLSNFQIQQEYTVCIPSKICDENSIPLYEDIYKTFKVTNNFLQVTSISINESQDFPLDDTNIPEITLNNTDTLFIEISFSCPIKKEKLNSAEKAINLESFFPSDVSNPKITQIIWNQTHTKLILEYSNISKAYKKQLYKLQINPSKSYFLTENNEYMEKDICIHFLTKED